MALYDFSTRMQNERGAYFNMPTYEAIGFGHSNERLRTNLKEGIYAYNERPTVRDARRRTSAIKGWRTRRAKRDYLTPRRGVHRSLTHEFDFLPSNTTPMFVGMYEDY